MYDPMMIQPMRDELTALGIKELRTAAEVDAFMADKNGSALIIVNSVCGCAAGMARPGIREALRNGARPDRIASVFAGQDTEATAKARGYFSEVPPSSPSFALFRDGKLAHFVPRHKIEGRDASSVAADLKASFDSFCAVAAS